MGERLLGVILGVLEGDLDWRALGEAHCWEGGAAFFPREQVRAIWETGLAHAVDLRPELKAGGQSLYFGASVAELVPMLFEVTVLGRRVTALDLEGPVTNELNRALCEAARLTGRALPTITTQTLESLGPQSFDHGWCVSLFTDPEAFPALHDHLYGIEGESEPGTLDGDLARAQPLLESFLERLAPGALLSTTDEELVLLEPTCAARGRQLTVSETARLSAVVGDAVRHGRLK
ncbi:MAG: hypothetical protein CMJ87_06630 [Planctomycetes bacterium]|jgi:hypothetical protein|nr:hypothetical protein [Planctomycetota bacterium]